MANRSALLNEKPFLITSLFPSRTRALSLARALSRFPLSSLYGPLSLSLSLHTHSRASTAKAEDKPKTNLLVLAAYFAAWYALNVGYNIANKQVQCVSADYYSTSNQLLLNF